MIATTDVTEVDVLERRLQRGLELLFDMELRGDRSGDYDGYLRLWTELLDRYEGMQAA